MKKITKVFNVYKFKELNEDQQQIVLKKLYDINVVDDWWNATYEDAKNVGIEINSFDLDKNRHATGCFLLSANEVAQNIFNEHGENCETFKTASLFMDTWQPIFNNYIETEEGEDNLMEIETNFLNLILEDYSIILQKESEYLQSKDAIIESIEANDYDFTEDCNIY